MDDDWDLHAVVRACCTTTTASSSSSAASTTTNATKTAFSADLDSLSSFPVNNNHQQQQLNSFAIPFENLREFHKHPTPSSLTILSASKEQSQILPRQQEFKRPHSFISTTANSTTSANSAPPRSKRRKNQLKRVCHVPVDVLSSDVWAWRKYGQKPIKGSPYPRGYYKCSGSKGCLARKQVERNKSDPTMFIVTYTAEHNHPAPTHRNSLAGSIRQKAPPQTTTTTTNEQPSCSSQANSMTMHEENQKIAPQSTKTESFEDIVQYEDDEPKLSNMAVIDDDFFEGLEDIACQDTEDGFSDKFPANFGVNWTTATAARGS